jgi:hypothetical protein
MKRIRMAIAFPFYLLAIGFAALEALFGWIADRIAGEPR